MTTRFIGVAFPYSTNRTNEVTVGGNNDGRIEGVVLGIAQQLHGDIDVGHFLLKSLPRRSTGMAESHHGQMIPVVDTHIRQRLQCFQVCVLSQWLVWIAGRRRNACRKVAHRHQVLSGFEHLFGHAMNVKPVEAPPSPRFEAVVQIKPVNVD